jgi:hypothetical protein
MNTTVPRYIFLIGHPKYAVPPRPPKYPTQKRSPAERRWDERKAEERRRQTRRIIREARRTIEATCWATRRRLRDNRHVIEMLLAA